MDPVSLTAAAVIGGVALTSAANAVFPSHIESRPVVCVAEPREDASLLTPLPLDLHKVVIVCEADPGPTEADAPQAPAEGVRLVVAEHS